MTPSAQILLDTRAIITERIAYSYRDYRFGVPITYGAHLAIAHHWHELTERTEQYHIAKKIYLPLIAGGAVMRFAERGGQNAILSQDVLVIVEFARQKNNEREWEEYIAAQCSLKRKAG